MADIVPAYILEAMRAGGFLDASGNIDSRYRWNPETMSLVENTYGGGSHYFGDIADPSMGTNVVNGDGSITNFAQGVTPYTFLSAGSNYPGGYATVAEGSPEYHSLRDDARTRNLQGIAQIAALVAGGAAGAQTGSGPLFGGGGSAAAAGELTTYPLATGGPVTVSSIPGVTAGTVGAGAAAAGAAGGGGAVTGAVGAASPWLNGAIIGSSVLSGLLGKEAADAGVEASREAIAEAKRQYDTTRTDLLPIINLAGSAAPTLQKYLSGDRSVFTESPSYQFNLAEGQKAIDRSLAARGRALSGAGVKESIRYASGMASNEDSKFVDQLLAAAGLGTTGAATVSHAGQNTAANVGNAAMAGANARSSGYNSINNAIQGGLSNFLLNRYLGRP